MVHGTVREQHVPQRHVSRAALAQHGIEVSAVHPALAAERLRWERKVEQLEASVTPHDDMSIRGQLCCPITPVVRADRDGGGHSRCHALACFACRHVSKPVANLVEPGVDDSARWAAERIPPLGGVGRDGVRWWRRRERWQRGRGDRPRMRRVRAAQHGRVGRRCGHVEQAGGQLAQRGRLDNVSPRCEALLAGRVECVLAQGAIELVAQRVARRERTCLDLHRRDAMRGAVNRQRIVRRRDKFGWHRADLGTEKLKRRHGLDEGSMNDVARAAASSARRPRGCGARARVATQMCPSTPAARARARARRNATPLRPAAVVTRRQNRPPGRPLELNS